MIHTTMVDVCGALSQLEAVLMRMGVSAVRAEQCATQVQGSSVVFASCRPAPGIEVKWWTWGGPLREYRLIRVIHDEAWKGRVT